LIKVMNLVAVLIAPAVVAMGSMSNTPSPLRYVIALVAFAVIVVMVVISTRREVGIAEDDGPKASASGGAPASASEPEFAVDKTE